MKKIKLILLPALMFIIMSANVNAQVKEAVVGVDGFTCSLCAKGVEGQLKDLDFIKSVKVNLKAATFTLVFYPNKKIDFSELREAVTDGGFSVRNITVKSAEGTLEGSTASGFTLSTGNSPAIKLKNVEGEFSPGDKVNVSGKINSSNSLNISKIIKL